MLKLFREQKIHGCLLLFFDLVGFSMLTEEIHHVSWEGSWKPLMDDNEALLLGFGQTSIL